MVVELAVVVAEAGAATAFGAAGVAVNLAMAMLFGEMMTVHEVVSVVVAVVVLLLRMWLWLWFWFWFWF